MGSMSASEIAGRLPGARRNGRGWLAYCPVHEADGKRHSPSLGILERDGRVLVHCYTGCSQADVIAALRARGLWPESRPRVDLTPADRAGMAREYAEAKRIRTGALYFADAASLMADWALEEMSPVNPERAVYTRLLMELRVSPEAEYRAWLEHSPTWAPALVHAGRDRERRLQVALAEWIGAGMPEVAHAR